VVEYFAAEDDDSGFFSSTLNSNPLQMPVLAMGGERGFGDITAHQQASGNAPAELTYVL
jgi:hypothetical protein